MNSKAGWKLSAFRNFPLTSTDYRLSCFLRFRHPADVLGPLSNCTSKLNGGKREKRKSKNNNLTWVFSCVCFFFLVLASFRGTVQHGLPLEIGDTVQILEKCEGTVAAAVPNSAALWKITAVEEHLLPLELRREPEHFQRTREPSVGPKGPILGQMSSAGVFPACR